MLNCLSCAGWWWTLLMPKFCWREAHVVQPRQSLHQPRATPQPHNPPRQHHNFMRTCLDCLQLYPSRRSCTNKWPASTSCFPSSSPSSSHRPCISHHHRGRLPVGVHDVLIAHLLLSRPCIRHPIRKAAEARREAQPHQARLSKRPTMLTGDVRLVAGRGACFSFLPRTNARLIDPCDRSSGHHDRSSSPFGSPRCDAEL